MKRCLMLILIAACEPMLPSSECTSIGLQVAHNVVWDAGAAHDKLLRECVDNEQKLSAINMELISQSTKKSNDDRKCWLAAGFTDGMPGNMANEFNIVLDDRPAHIHAKSCKPEDGGFVCVGEKVQYCEPLMVDGGWRCK